MNRLAAVLLLATGAVTTSPLADARPAEQPPLRPTEALHQAWVDLAVMPAGTRQPTVVQPLLDRTAKTIVDESEELALGALYFLNFMPAQADAIFSKYLDRRDAVGRWAWIYHEQMVFRAFDKHEQAETDLIAFRRQFPVTPTDLTYASAMVSNLAARYRSMGDHDKAASLVLEDVSGLDVGVPFRSFQQLSSFYDSLQKAGHGERALALLTEHRDRLRALVKAAGGDAVAPDADLFKAPPPHKAGQLHLSWDTRIADDLPGQVGAAWQARLAAGALPAIEEGLKRMGGAARR